MNGVIKKVVPSRGFGFIAAEDGTEYFFHRDELRGLEFANLKPGQRVTFDAQQGPKGPRGGQRVSDGVVHSDAPGDVTLQQAEVKTTLAEMIA